MEVGVGGWGEGVGARASVLVRRMLAGGAASRALAPWRSEDPLRGSPARPNQLQSSSSYSTSSTTARVDHHSSCSWQATQLYRHAAKPAKPIAFANVDGEERPRTVGWWHRPY